MASKAGRGVWCWDASMSHVPRAMTSALLFLEQTQRLETMIKRVVCFKPCLCNLYNTGNSKVVKVEPWSPISLNCCNSNNVKECVVMVASSIFGSSIHEMFLPQCLSIDTVEITCDTWCGGTSSGLGVAEMQTTQ